MSWLAQKYAKSGGDGKRHGGGRRGKPHAEKQGNPFEEEAPSQDVDSTFFAKAFDPGRHVLQSIPSNAYQSLLELTSHLQQQHTAKDTALDQIQAQLGKALLNNYGRFRDGMKHIQEIDLDISRSLVQTTNSLRMLKESKQLLIDRSRRRARLKDVKERVQWARNIIAQESLAKTASTHGNFCKVIRGLQTAQAQLKAGSSKHDYRMLDGLRSRLQVCMPQIKSQLDEFLDQVLTKFEPEKWEQYLRSCLILDQHAEDTDQIVLPSQSRGAPSEDKHVPRDDYHRPGTLQAMGLGTGKARSQESKAEEAPKGPCLSSLASILQERLLRVLNRESKAAVVDLLVSLQSPGWKHKVAEAERQVEALQSQLQRKQTKKQGGEESKGAEGPGRSGLSFSDDEDDGSSDRDTESPADDADAESPQDPELLKQLEQAKAHLESTNATPRKQKEQLSALSFSDVCELVPPYKVVEAVWAVAKALAHVMHAHYCICQWMRRPFDPKNRDKKFLHRCGPDAEDPEETKLTGEEDLPRNEATEQDPGGRGSFTVKKHNVEQLVLLRQDLMACRRIVWRQSHHLLASVLFSSVAHLRGAFPAEELVQALAVAERFMRVGVAYGDSDVLGLTSGLRELCRQFMDYAQSNAITALGKMVGKELWVRVPVEGETISALLASLSSRNPTESSFGIRAEANETGDAGAAAITGFGSPPTPGAASPTLVSPSARSIASAQSGFSRQNPRGEALFTLLRVAAEIVIGVGRGVETSTPTHASLETSGGLGGTTPALHVGTGAGAVLAKISIAEDLLATIKTRTAEGKQDSEMESPEASTTVSLALAPGELSTAFAHWLDKGNPFEVNNRRTLFRSLFREAFASQTAEQTIDHGAVVQEQVSNALISLALGGQELAAVDIDESEEESEEEDADVEGGDEEDDDDEEDEVDDREEKKTGTASKTARSTNGEETKDADDAIMVSATVLNGIVPHTGKFVALVRTLPPLAVDAFAALTRLFDTYLHSVATLFLSTEAQIALFTPSVYTSTSELPGPGKTSLTVSDSPEVCFLAKNPDKFDYLDGSALRIGVNVNNELEGLARAEIHTTTQQRGAADQESACVGVANLSQRATRGPTRVDDPYIEQNISVHNRAAYSTLASVLYEVQKEIDEGIRIRSNLEVSEFPKLPKVTSSVGNGVNSVVALHPSVTMQNEDILQDPNTLWGLSARCIAVESLQFALGILQHVRPILESSVAPGYVSRLSLYYGRSALAVIQLRSYLYHTLPATLVSRYPAITGLPNAIAAQRWEHVKEAGDPSSYVQDVVSSIKELQQALAAQVDYNGLPQPSYKALWSSISGLLYERFVEGVSRMKKCTVEGRGQLAVDINAITSALKLGPYQPEALPRNKMHADRYVKAFYLQTEEDLLEWMKVNKWNYELRHMKALLNYGVVGSKAKKKRLQELHQAIGAIYLGK